MMAETAPRISEFLGLMVKHFHYRETTMGPDRKPLEVSWIEIRQQVYYDREGKWRLTSELKTRDSKRDIPLDPEMADLLHDYIEERQLTPDQYIFGQRWNHNSPTSGILNFSHHLSWAGSWEIERAPSNI